MITLSPRVTALAIFIIAFATYAVYASSSILNAQHITRLGLALAILEEGRLDIDRYASQTIDKAEFNGHTYADKPPGLSFLAIPAVVAARAVLQATGHVSNPARNLRLYVRVAITGTVAIFGALAVALVYLTARRLGAREEGALFASAALGFGTLYFGWSTVLFAHPVSGSLLLLGMVLILARHSLLAGLILGICLVVDLPAAPAVMAVGLLSLMHGWRSALWCIAAGVVGLMPLLVYNAMIFGSPFKIGYTEVVGFEGMRTGVLGIGAPSLMVLYEILFGFYRGLVPFSPILVLVPLGLIVMRERAVAVVIAAVIASFLVINTSYFYWHGGDSTGARHLIAMLPLACLALAFVWPRQRWLRVLLLLALGYGMAVCLMAASTNMFASEAYPNPLLHVILPRIRAGEWVDTIPGLIAIAAFAGLATLRLRHSRSETS